MFFTIIAVILAIFLGLVILSFVVQSNQFVRVTGFGTVAKSPDEASVTIGYRSDNIEKENLSTAQSDNAAQFTRILDSVRASTPDAQIETRTFIVAPVAAGNATATESQKYTIYSSANVRVKDALQIALLPQIIDQAVASGSNSVGDVQYSLSDALRKSATTEAQASAMQDAEAKASRLAQLSKRSIGPVQQIVDNDSSVQVWRASSVSSPSVVPSATTTTTPLIPPREIDINTQITVQYILF